MNKESTLYKKVLGCILGGAAGDAYGGPIEMLSADYIREIYGGPVTDMVDYSRRPEGVIHPTPHTPYAWKGDKGTYTDDSYFALLNAQCIINKGGRITCDDIAEYWVDHCNIEHGWKSLQATYAKLTTTMRCARTLGEGNIGDNSSAMCIGPIGAINACNPSQAALDAYDVVSMWHDSYSREAAAIIAAATAEAFKADATVDSVVQAAMDNIPGRECSEMYAPMKKAIELARKAKDTEELTKLYYDSIIINWDKRGSAPAEDNKRSLSCEAREAIPCAIGMFLNSNGDYKKTIIGAANFGRDCDTIACMAGYVAGAFCGADGIPEGWKEAVLAANPEPDILEIAEKLTECILNEQKKAENHAAQIGALI